MNLSIVYSDDDEEFEVVANGAVVGTFNSYTTDNDTLLNIRDMVVELGDKLGIKVELTGGSE